MTNPATPTDYQAIAFSTADGLATLTLNRADKLNALTFPMISEIADALEICQRRDDIRAVLLTSAGERAFCVGYDLKAIGEPFDPPTRDAHLRSRQRVDLAETAIVNLSKPVIAAVRGHVIGSGLDLALACDYLIAADTAKLSESRIFRANMATTHWLPLYVGWAKAKDMIYRGTVITGTEAEQIGLVNKTVPADTLDKEALAIAQEFATGPTVALGLFKRALNAQITDTLTTGQNHRNTYGLLLRDTDDIKEARAAFKEKRNPNFTGH